MDQQQLTSSRLLPFASFQEAQEHLFDHVDSIKNKVAELISRVSHSNRKEVQALQQELENNLDRLMRVVSDLNAASESEIKKWRTLYKK